MYRSQLIVLNSFSNCLHNPPSFCLLASAEPVPASRTFPPPGMRLLPPCPTMGSLRSLFLPSLSTMDQSFRLTWQFLWLFISFLVCLCRSRTRGPIGPGKYGYGKAPYILPLQTDSTHSLQRLRRQRSSFQHSRSQEASGPSYGYSPPRGWAPHHGPLYQSDSGPHSELQASEASIYQLPLIHDQGFPVASSSLHSPETSSSHGMRAHSTTLNFAQPARSAAISCIGAYRQYKMCNTKVSTLPPLCLGWLLCLPFCWVAVNMWKAASFLRGSLLFQACTHFRYGSWESLVVSHLLKIPQLMNSKGNYKWKLHNMTKSV